jgi:hypothetical protein
MRKINFLSNLNVMNKKIFFFLKEKFHYFYVKNQYQTSHYLYQVSNYLW